MSYPKVVALDTESVDEISSVVLTLTRLPLAGLFGADSLTIRSGGEAVVTGLFASPGQYRACDRSSPVASGQIVSFHPVPLVSPHSLTWSIAFRNHHNQIHVYDEISKIVHDILSNGAKLAIVSANPSKDMSVS